MGSKTTSKKKTLVTRVVYSKIYTYIKEKILVTDTISDVLTRIRNAHMINHQIVKIPLTKMSIAIIEILKQEGFIENYETYSEKNRDYLVVYLRYSEQSREPVICKIERVSKPGLRVYANSKELPIVLNNLGIAIMSTSKGVMTNTKAKELGVGGEVLCYVW